MANSIITCAVNFNMLKRVFIKNRVFFLFCYFKYILNSWTVSGVCCSVFRILLSASVLRRTADLKEFRETQYLMNTLFIIYTLNIYNIYV